MENLEKKVAKFLRKINKYLRRAVERSKCVEVFVPMDLLITAIFYRELNIKLKTWCIYRSRKQVRMYYARDED